MLIVAYAVVDDDSLVKSRVQQYCNKLMKKDPNFVCPRLNVWNLKDVGNFDMNKLDI